MIPVSGVILAGGQSRRMGTDKAFLTIEGRPLIEHVVETVQSVSEEIIIVTNAPEEYQGLGAQVITDVIPGKGSLGGVYSGLLTAEGEYGLTVACDMPFLNQRLLRFMALTAQEHDAVIPRVASPRLDRIDDEGDEETTAKEKHLHPLHAVYAKACLEPIKAALDRDDLRLISFLPQVRTRYLEEHEVAVFDPDLLSVFNANTPDDWERVKQMLRAEHGG